jgi:microcystin-dependent protein
MEGTIATVTPWAPNFAPRNWAFCNGALLPIASNTALFSLIGTVYGGDGRTTTALPNLVTRVAMGDGHGPGLTSRVQGSHFGADTVTLTTAQMLSHGHGVTVGLSAVSTPGTTNVPGPGVVPAAASLAGSPVGGYGPGDGVTVLGGLGFAGGTAAVTDTGGGQSHENRMPFQVLNYVICLFGFYPSRP